MLISELKTPMTVEMLLEVTSSQLSLYGQKLLVTKPELDFVKLGVELFVGDKTLLCCMSNQEMADDELTLNHLHELLQSLPANELITATNNMNESFRVGFEGDEKFVEVISYADIKKSKQTKREVMVTDILLAFKANGTKVYGDTFFALAFKSESELIEICHELHIGVS
ncbi:hypothetical protein [Moritella sp. F3]|uniref:hypothetical protein n=1 Tax=Moritella sp. F3 TaxID=2718882 RepID=UPI0018E14768|nr:hypothetical protein [Moritella sp. F3]GIC77079.1 hypothetical protein FMO001_18060 [Moritella sp. F1]GIC82198.1 hypothetical protein FMO003_24790 [Moritella sp. F3]